MQRSKAGCEPAPPLLQVEVKPAGRKQQARAGLDVQFASPVAFAAANKLQRQQPAASCNAAQLAERVADALSIRWAAWPDLAYLPVCYPLGQAADIPDPSLSWNGYLYIFCYAVQVAAGRAGAVDCAGCCWPPELCQQCTAAAAGQVPAC